MLHLRFLRTARRRFFSFAMADSSGKELTYGQALAASLILARIIRRRCPDEQMVGMMLPATVGGVLANIATLMAGKVPVNLNFTAGRESIALAIEQCRIKTVLTSRVFLAKAKVDQPAGAVFLEDVMKEITPLMRTAMWAAAFVLPRAILERLFVAHDRNRDSLATVIFSSGSTGTPKGVMLSHRNVLTNVEGIAQIYHVTDDDRLMGVLPLFHSFGFTGTIWLPLVMGFGVVYHPNPLDAGTIGELVQKHRATMMISTPSFCLGYTRKCTPEQFASLRYAVVGAEKLREPIARAFKEKYGLELLEGYGCTEMSPAVAINAPDSPGTGQRNSKPGTVGRPLPGVLARSVDRETGNPLPPGGEGLLLLKGDNVMLGYLNAPEKTREVLRDGWYVTGDIATIDEDGFIRLTDRLSRFSKIAGEMVPHLKIEETITRVLGDTPCVVTAIPDESKGERLVAFHTSKSMSPEALWSQLCESSLPKLWIPKRENLYYVDAIPLLGTGKVDLKRGTRSRARDGEWNGVTLRRSSGPGPCMTGRTLRSGRWSRHSFIRPTSRRRWRPDEVTGTLWWSRAVATSGILTALLSPILGAAADRAGAHKRFLATTTTLCICATTLLAFVRPSLPNAAMIALGLYVIADLCFETGYVFYNAFLPRIASPERIGRVSGYGWGLGYVGGLVCMGIALVGFVRPEVPWFGISTVEGFNIRATNLLVAAWFGLFSLPLFLFVPDRRTTNVRLDVRGSIRELGATLREIARYREIVKFLIARLVFNDGLVTVFAFGGIYAAGTFGMSLSEVIAFGVVLNVAAGAGAVAFGFLDDKIGGKKTIMVTLVALAMATAMAVWAPTAPGSGRPAS